MVHASYDFPTHLVPLLELGLLIAFLALALGTSGRASEALPLLRRLSARAGSNRRLVTVAFLMGFLGNALLTAWSGFPVPRIADGVANLLTAETLAAGHLSNPPAPHKALVPNHVLERPHFVSKYPPGNGAILAIGARLGHPGIGLWLSSGLLCASFCWCLLMWLPSPWALLGTVLVLFRLGIGSYWAHSYWGGSAQAAAGALVIGSLGCLSRKGGDRSLRPWAILGIGLVALAFTRPYEGLLLSLPTALWLMSLLTKRARQDRKGAATRISVLLVIGGLGLLMLAIYNQATSGSPYRFAHQVFAQSLGGEFIWQPVVPASATSLFDPEEPLLTLFPKHLFGRLGRASFFAIGPLLSLLTVLSFPIWRRRKGLVLVALCAATVMLGDSLLKAYHAHYPAPATSAFVVLGIAGLRAFCLAPPARLRSAGWLIIGALFLQVASFAFQLPAHRQDPDSPRILQKRIDDELRERGGEHLVLVHPDRTEIWNSRDLETSPVLWALDLGAEETDQLFELYPDRTLWMFDWAQDDPLIALETREAGARLGYTLSTIPPTSSAYERTSPVD